MNQTLPLKICKMVDTVNVFLAHSDREIDFMSIEPEGREHYKKHLQVNQKRPEVDSGQALTSLLIIMFVGIIVVSTASALVSLSSLSTSRLSLSAEALAIAEAGTENALLRLLRNPAYVGETLPVNDGFATITIASTNPTIVDSRGQIGSIVRTIRVSASFQGGVMTINSWKEL